MKKITYTLLIVLFCMVLVSFSYTFGIKGQFDGFTFWPMIIFSVSLCLWVWNCLYKKQCKTMNRDITVSGHNYPESLSSTNGIGKIMLGHFMYSSGLLVSYCVYIFIGIPVGIKGCYLCSNRGRTYTFYGEVEGKLEEIIYVLTIVPSIMICIMSGIIVLAILFK